MYIGCVNSVVNHNFTLTRAHLLLQSVSTQPMYIYWTYSPLITNIILWRWW